MTEVNEDTINVRDHGLHQVVVIGGGFAGINVVRSLRKGKVQIVVLDRNNFHQFQPLLYQVATCGLDPDAIIFPLRKLFERYPNVSFRMAEVQKINEEKKELETSAGKLHYDTLIIGTGSMSNFFGSDQIEALGIGMKGIRESLDIRSQILHNLELAANTRDEAEKEALTNFVVVGGGPAGVETAGALAEFKSHILSKDYPSIDQGMMNIYLVQSGPRVLKTMSEKASTSALEELKEMGVNVLLENRVTGYDGLHITTKTDFTMNARVLIWTAGVKGQVPDGIKENAIASGSRIKVDTFNRVEGTEHIYAIGDCAAMISEEFPHGHPMVAPAAIQQGKHLANNLKAQLEGGNMQPFEYFDKGTMATIGRRRAVADLGKAHLTGFIAWIIWCFVHVISLIGARNRFLVFLHWFMNYFTYEKGNRFIVRDPPRNLK